MYARKFTILELCTFLVFLSLSLNVFLFRITCKLTQNNIVNSFCRKDKQEKKLVVFFCVADEHSNMLL